MVQKIFDPKTKFVGRVLILEDDLVMGEWLCHSLARLGIECCWCTTLSEALELLKSEEHESRFHAIISDIFLTDGQPSGMKLLEEAKHLDLPVCVITSSSSFEIAKKALNLSAFCLLEKPFEIQMLHSKLLELWQEPAFLSALLERSLSVNGLTGKEKEVVRLLMKGLSNKEIADVLKVTEKTIKFHVTSVFEKYGVRSRSELQSSIFPV